MFQKNISGKDTDYYTMNGDSVSISINPLISGLYERMNQGIGCGLFEAAAKEYISECESFFKKSPAEVQIKIKEELTAHAKNFKPDSGVEYNKKPAGILTTIITTAIFCTAFGVAAYLMIPLLD